MTPETTGMVLAAASSSLLSVLKYVLLAVLWVFFILVLRAVLTEVRRPGTSDQAAMRQPGSARLRDGATRPASQPAPWEPAAPMGSARVGGLAAPARATGAALAGPARSPVSAAETSVGAEWAARAERRAPVSGLAVVEPAKERGRSYPVADEMTIGRATTCAISMPDDSFISSRHARVWHASGVTWVEDLGSTNGTLLNGGKLAGPSVLNPGDRIQVGKTVLEATR